MASSIYSWCMLAIVMTCALGCNSVRQRRCDFELFNATKEAWDVEIAIEGGRGQWRPIREFPLQVRLFSQVLSSVPAWLDVSLYESEVDAPVPGGRYYPLGKKRLSKVIPISIPHNGNGVDLVRLVISDGPDASVVLEKYK